MNLENSNEMEDRNQYITENEVTEEILSETTGGGALGTAAMIGGIGVIGTGVGAGFGTALAHQKHAQGVEIGAGIGAVLGTAIGGAAVADMKSRAPREVANVVEMATHVPR